MGKDYQDIQINVKGSVNVTVTREGNEIIGKRTFDAPIQQVFNAYTTKEKFEQWFFPKGGEIQVFEFNPKAGGKNFFKITMPDAQSYTVQHYEMIEAPHKIIYRDYFADEKGHVDTKMHGMRVEIYLTSQGTHQTEVRSVSVMPSEEAAKQLMEMGVEQGMESTLDQLEELLKQ
ncbi:SRPBCC domain-containing protein [Staphylococcus simulans]|uniref:SRPBCC family protein n=1 Tax=Staphylococcus simulans TaxID=1286 RepID=UPI00280ADC9F|nr:SRPBCC domain-containing protein [Staphylococcus simulans]